MDLLEALVGDLGALELRLQDAHGLLDGCLVFLRLLVLLGLVVFLEGENEGGEGEGEGGEKPSG